MECVVVMSTTVFECCLYLPGHYYQFASDTLAHTDVTELWQLKSSRERGRERDVNT